MLRKNVYITQGQVMFLGAEGSISISEHIRRAIDQYIAKIQTESVSASKSKGKGSD